MGEYIAVARRHKDTWYIGVLNGTSARHMEIDLSFMGKGEQMVQAHADGINADKQAKYSKITVQNLKDGEKLQVEMSRGGGFIGIIR